MDTTTTMVITKDIMEVIIMPTDTKVTKVIMVTTVTTGIITDIMGNMAKPYV